MNNPYLTGARVYLRPLEAADAPTAVPWLNDPQLSRMVVRRLPMNLRAEEEFIDRMSRSEHDVVLGIVMREDDRLIGVTGFHQLDWRNRHASLGITIGLPEFCNRGYGTEALRLMLDYAFDTLNLHRVWLLVFEYNERAIRVYERLGFRREGRLRQDNFRDGRYWDTILMGVLRDDWRALAGASSSA